MTSEYLDWRETALLRGSWSGEWMTSGSVAILPFDNAYISLLVDPKVSDGLTRLLWFQTQRIPLLTGVKFWLEKRNAYKAVELQWGNRGHAIC